MLIKKMAAAAEWFPILALFATLLIRYAESQCGNNPIVGKMPDGKSSVCKNSKGVCYYNTLNDCSNENGCADIVSCNETVRIYEHNEMLARKLVIHFYLFITFKGLNHH
jgi:hypothetical protein